MGGRWAQEGEEGGRKEDDRRSSPLRGIDIGKKRRIQGEREGKERKRGRLKTIFLKRRKLEIKEDERGLPATERKGRRRRSAPSLFFNICRCKNRKRKIEKLAAASRRKRKRGGIGNILFISPPARWPKKKGGVSGIQDRRGKKESPSHLGYSITMQKKEL